MYCLHLTRRLSASVSSMHTSGRVQHIEKVSINFWTNGEKFGSFIAILLLKCYFLSTARGDFMFFILFLHNISEPQEDSNREDITRPIQPMTSKYFSIPAAAIGIFMNNRLIRWSQRPINYIIIRGITLMTLRSSVFFKYSRIGLFLGIWYIVENTSITDLYILYLKHWCTAINPRWLWWNTSYGI